MKPILKYRGGKSKEINEIIKFIPKFDGRYIEPFFGGGSLYFYLEPSNAIINDLNESLIKFYKEVSKNYETIKVELNELERLYICNRKIFDEAKIKKPDERVVDPNEELYYSIRDMFNKEIESKYNFATLYYFINKTAYSGMIRYNSQGKFNVPYGRYKNFNTKLLTIEHSNLLAKCTIFQKDYSEIFSIAKDDDFIFLDPPYDCVFSDYGNLDMKDGFGDERHIKLATDFKNLKCKALMVIGKTDLTQSLYEDMIIHEYDKSYAVNIKNRFKSSSKHILVANYK